MYVRDDAVDAVVARDKTLQEVVRGRRLMLWRPGFLAAVAAQGCLMFGGGCLVCSCLFFQPPTAETFKSAIVCGLLPLGVLTAGLFQALVRGWAQARTSNYRFALVLSGLSLCATLTSLAFWKTFSLVYSGASLAFHLCAVWLIAGEGYALTSAMFRAQRKYARVQSR